MSHQDRLDMENVMHAAFKDLIADPAYGGRYVSLTPGHPCKISDAEYRKHSSAARKKLNESQSAVLCPASACTDRSARAGDGTSSDKQPGQQGSRQDAEPWWMSPAPNRPGGFQVC